MDGINALYTVSAPGEAKLSSVCAGGYRISNSFRLLRPAGNISGGIMEIISPEFTGYGPHNILAGDIKSECCRMRYRGVVMNMKRRGNAVSSFCSLLGDTLFQCRKKLYVPIELASGTERLYGLLSAGNSVGSFRDYIISSLGNFPPHRAALVFSRSAVTFFVSDRGGAAAPAETPKAGFYSKSLCARYAVKRVNRDISVTLWEDGQSVRDKLSIANSIGIAEAFIPCGLQYIPPSRED